jgi:translation elongation factor EF-G
MRDLEWFLGSNVGFRYEFKEILRENVTDISPIAVGLSPNKHNRIFVRTEPLSNEVKDALKNADQNNFKKFVRIWKFHFLRIF